MHIRSTDEPSGAFIMVCSSGKQFCNAVMYMLVLCPPFEEFSDASESLALSEFFKMHFAWVLNVDVCAPCT